MRTPNMLLSLFFLSGALAACPRSPLLFIKAPKEMKALSGSCLQIPCTFKPESQTNTFDGRRTTFGVWIKSDPRYNINPNNVIFNSSSEVNTYPMTIPGNVRQKNCTSLFSNVLTSYSDDYYFRVENGEFKATASCDAVKIRVQDSAPRPRLEIPGDLKEDQSVSITCSAPTPCPQSPPQLTWSLQQDPHNIMEENPDGTFTTKIQETLTLSEKHDGHNISCSARYPVDGGDVRTSEETMTLSVSYAPRDTSVSISPSGPVSVGSRVELSCSSRAKPPVRRYTWFKKSRGGDTSVSEGQVYSFNVTQGGVYYCVATNDLGSGTSAETHVPPEGHSSLLWGTVCGAIIILLCVIVAVWWFKLKHQTPQEIQSLPVEQPAVQNPIGPTGTEDIHYGQISFSNLRRDPSSNSLQDRGAQQETLYAQVKVSKRTNSFTQTAAGLEDLYAHVKKT